MRRTRHPVWVRAPSIEARPKKPDGSVDEDKLRKQDQMGEIENIAAGSSESKSFDLTPGAYIAFCNIVVDTGANAIVHFARGMHATLTVTG